jgi:hypothetical protein
LLLAKIAAAKNAVASDILSAAAAARLFLPVNK